MIDFNEFDTTIVIESFTVVKNSITNEPEKTWSTFKTRKAKTLGPESKDKYEANQQVSLSTVRYKIYRTPSINEQMRIKKGSDYFYISGIADFGRQGYMIITAEKRNNE